MLLVGAFFLNQQRKHRKQEAFTTPSYRSGI